MRDLTQTIRTTDFILCYDADEEERKERIEIIFIIMEGLEMERKNNSERLALSVPEMAKALGISRVKAYQLANRANFPAVRLDGRIIIPVEQLRKWLDRGGADGKSSL